MNLHGIASPYIGAINPMVQGSISTSMGYSTGSSGKRTPLYADPIEAPMQVQSLETRDLQQLDGMNVSFSTHKIYLFGELNGVVRRGTQGGDLIRMLSGRMTGYVFLTTAVLEDWPDWVCVSATMQNDK